MVHWQKRDYAPYMLHACMAPCNSERITQHGDSKRLMLSDPPEAVHALKGMEGNAAVLLQVL